jgi:hypothetical protein
MSSRTHLHSCSFSDLGDSAATSITVPAPPNPRQDGGGGPNKRNEVAILTDHVLVLILSRLMAHYLCSCKCVCLLEIWAIGTCTACIHDHHQAIGPAAIKGRPARANAVNQREDQAN